MLCQNTGEKFSRALEELTEDRNRLAARNEVRRGVSCALGEWRRPCTAPSHPRSLTLLLCVNRVVDQELSAQLTMVSSQREELIVYRQDLDNKLQCVLCKRQPGAV